MKTIKCWKYGRWCWHFDKCRWCGTSKKSWNTRHKGHGLCINCFDKNRAERPKRKEVRQKANKKYKDKYMEKYRTDLNFRKKVNDEHINWRHTSQAYKKYRAYRGKLIMNFNYFLKKQHKFDKRHNGVEIIINGERVKTPIQAPRALDSEKDKTMNKIELFKEVYKKYKSVHK